MTTTTVKSAEELARTLIYHLEPEDGGTMLGTGTKLIQQRDQQRDDEIWNRAMDGAIELVRAGKADWPWTESALIAAKKGVETTSGSTAVQQPPGSL